MAGAGLLLVSLGVMALFGYDHRQSDMSTGWTALSDGRVVSIDADGFSGPTSLTLVGHRRTEVRPLPPVLSRSTSVRPARGSGGFALSPNGWVLLRLAQLGRDTEGGQVTEISPTNDLAAGLPVLHWRDTAIIGVSNQGSAVFRSGTTLSLIGVDGEGVELLDLRRLGVTNDLSNLAGVALAPDGRMAVLVGHATGPDGYRLFQRLPGGAADRVTRIPRADLVVTAATESRVQRERPAVAFAGEEVIVAGNAGLVRVREGRMLAHVSVSPSDRARLPDAPSTLAAWPGDRWVLGADRLLVLDASGHLHEPGFGPCPTDPHIRSRCPAVIAGLRVPHPADVLPGAAGWVIGMLFVALAWAGRVRRPECPRLRLAATTAGAAWVGTWLVAGLAWAELPGSPPLLLLGGAVLAILAPAFPASPRAEQAGEPSAWAQSYQPWVTDRATGRLGGRAAAGSGARRLEVVPLPSGS